MTDILFWIFFGAIAGWLASKIAGTDDQMGCITNIAVSVVGSAIGGFIGAQLFDATITGWNLGSFALAIGGSVILLLALKAFAGKS